MSAPKVSVRRRGRRRLAGDGQAGHDRDRLAAQGREADIDVVVASSGEFQVHGHDAVAHVRSQDGKHVEALTHEGHLEIGARFEFRHIGSFGIRHGQVQANSFPGPDGGGIENDMQLELPEESPVRAMNVRLGGPGRRAEHYRDEQQDACNHGDASSRVNPISSGIRPARRHAEATPDGGGRAETTRPAKPRAQGRRHEKTRSESGVVSAGGGGRI
jgi:hypothetical protein